MLLKEQILLLCSLAMITMMKRTVSDYLLLKTSQTCAPEISESERLK